MSNAARKDREFELTVVEFKKLTGLIRSLTGIVLGDHKMEMLYGRLARRLRQLGLSSFSQYCDLLDSNQAENEIGFLVNAVTTNLTKFYRESHHFDAMTEHLTSVLRDPARVRGDKKVQARGQKYAQAMSLKPEKLNATSQRYWQYQKL